MYVFFFLPVLILIFFFFFFFLSFVSEIQTSNVGTSLLKTQPTIY